MGVNRSKIKQTKNQIEFLKKDNIRRAKEAKIDGSEFKDGFLHGSIRMKKIKCGKKNCRCFDDVEKFGHGPYPHLQWWEDGKIKTRYLNKKKFPVYSKILNNQIMIKTLEEKIENEENQGKIDNNNDE